MEHVGWKALVKSDLPSKELKRHFLSVGERDGTKTEKRFLSEGGASGTEHYQKSNRQRHNKASVRSSRQASGEESKAYRT